MAANLIVDDSFVKDETAKIYSDLNRLDCLLSKYLQCMRRLRTTAIKDGSTAEALDAFLQYANQLNDDLHDFADSTRMLMKSYPFSIDNADQYLF